MNIFIGTGNLGSDPVLAHKQTKDGETRPVVNFSVRFHRDKPDGEGRFTDNGGFWRDIALWGPRAEAIAKSLRKGALVIVVGEEKQETWQDKESGKEKSKIVILADVVGVDPLAIEEITYRQRSSKEE